MRYLHPKFKLYDRGRQLPTWYAAHKPAPPPGISPEELGRLGGEMARRMIDAALAYLTERTVAETKASFARAAFGEENRQSRITPPVKRT